MEKYPPDTLVGAYWERVLESLLITLPSLFLLRPLPTCGRGIGPIAQALLNLEVLIKGAEESQDD
jgi:hypothetical protein